MIRKKIRDRFAKEKPRGELAWLYGSFYAATLVQTAFFIFQGEEGGLFGVAAMALYAVFPLSEKLFSLRIPTATHFFGCAFVAAAQIGGEMYHLYHRLPAFDSLLHFSAGFLLAAVGLSLLPSSIPHKTFFATFFAFCFSMTVEVGWEFAEFLADYALGTDMQRDALLSSFHSALLGEGDNLLHAKEIRETVVITAEEQLRIPGLLDVGLHDTAKDLAVNGAGGLAFCLLAPFARVRAWFVPQRKG